MAKINEKLLPFIIKVSVFNAADGSRILDNSGNVVTILSVVMQDENNNWIQGMPNASSVYIAVNNQYLHFYRNSTSTYSKYVSVTYLTSK